ncbi:response regulator transcription factor [Lentzea flava]|uniref:Helix-turn-helix transcriptional regulator n=1 Tax=Lentzea flava TaxID=103732 RepID=A0ABQ2UV90_9PSEU|nr:response regulator transcription factor [Lentzea flava]MCP2202019.1 regulatory protein, luxR family [Lentzea flava]GGU54376.1 helix-turn-helix transcriptional regulator [Lentzea flava]
MDAVATAHLTRARELHRDSRWEEACGEYAAADVEEPLGVEDLEAFAEAAQVCARGDEAAGLLRRVFDLRVAAGELDAAAQVAFWLWWVLLNTNQLVQANGWLQQTSRILGPVTNPWLKIPEVMFERTTGDRSRAGELLGAIVRENSGEVVPWALSMWGQTLIDDGRLQDGLDRLEEAMAVLHDDGLSPRVTPWIYCAAVRGCCLARDFARAQAWNRSMAGWLDSLSSLGGAYLGNCRIYRSRLMCLGGAWPDALDEIAAVCDDLDGHTGWICGHAYYQLGEVRRLRGEWDAAEDAYRRAAEHGCPIQPGLALLRLAEGDADAASAGVRRALTEVTSRPERIDLLKAAVTIHLEDGKIQAARDAVTELEEITAELPMPVIEAERSAARGELALAEGDPAGALPLLRRAAGIWEDQNAPHEVAKLNVLIGQACRALADHDGARLQFTAARRTFERLGARPDLAVLDRIGAAEAGTHGLTRREVEVLRLMARGKANRAIAAELHLSERTVHRHVSNIFGKLGVDSRTAAVTYGIKHRIVEMGTL